MKERSRREWLPIEFIDAGERFRQEYGELEELAESLQEFEEPLQAVVVKETDNPKRFLLLAGGRRLAAHKLAGEPLVKADIWPADLTPLECRKIELAENLRRKSLTWQEEVRLTGEIDRLVKEEYGETEATQEEVATLLGKDRTVVTRDLQLGKDMLVVPELAQAKSKKDALAKAAALRERAIKNEIARRALESSASGKVEAKKQALLNAYVLADCLEYMPTMQESSVDLVEFDPPYGIAFEQRYKGDTWLADQGDGYTDFAELGTYEEFLRGVYAQAYRILKETGWILTWCSTEYLHNTIALLEEAGFLPSKFPIIWSKPAGTIAHNHHPDFKFTVTYETAIYARRSKKSLLNLRGPDSVYHVKGVSPKLKIHPNEKPTTLMASLLTAFCPAGSTLYCPCAGSGNTMFVAGTLKHWKVSGTDTNEASRNAYLTRVAQWEPGSIKMPDVDEQAEVATL